MSIIDPLPRVRPAAGQLVLVLLAALVVGIGPVEARGGPEPLRFATFNASLNRPNPGQALADLSAPGNAQASAVAEIIQRTRPDVVLVNEFDYIEGPVDGNAMTDAFQANYLSIGQNGADPINYPYVYVAPSNTGVPSGVDLNNDGRIDGPNDAFGFGFFPGQFGMAVFSQYPIDYDAVRTFQLFRWADMPGALLPVDPATGEAWYSADAVEVLRLSSKSHWDVPIEVGAATVHFLVSHPTPPVFDGPEDRNGRRNHDEIRFWADYITPGASGYITDDEGSVGGLRPGSAFVIAGDLNADPFDGDSVPGAAQQLLDHPRVNATVTPTSDGAVEASELQTTGGVNAAHRGDPAHDTADFSEPPGNLRVDYVLPSRQLRIVDAGVFWPVRSDPLFRLTGVFVRGVGFPSSDHRLVWVDVSVPGSSGGR